MAFSPLGWQAICFSEIEKFPSEVLAHHYPNVPNMGDMTTFREWPEEYFRDADMIVGGPPCQSFSVAGAREGLNDERGNLTLTFTEIINHADRIRRKHNRPPVIVLYENVPGIFSDKTNAFGCLLGALAGEDEALVPSGKKWTNAGAVFGPERAIAWRILDAQYFGLAQRRRRVFVVASAREGFSPAEVLFEFDGVRRDTPPSREQGQEATGNVGTGFASSSFGGYSEGIGTLRAAGGDLGGGSETLVAGAIAIQGTVIGRKAENGPQGKGYDESGVCFTQTAVDRHAVAVYPINTMTMLGRPSDDLKPRMGLGIGGEFDPQNTLSAAHCHAVAIAGTQNDAFRDASNNLAPTLRSGSGGGAVNQAVATPTAVRRLTPKEAERLMGFPDGWTAIPWRNKPASECPDGHRYKALGNSWAVPVVHWIGKRIANHLNEKYFTW